MFEIWTVLKLDACLVHENWTSLVLGHLLFYLYSERPKSELVRYLSRRDEFGFRHCNGPICPKSEQHLNLQILAGLDRFIKKLHIKWSSLMGSDLGYVGPLLGLV